LLDAFAILIFEQVQRVQSLHFGRLHNASVAIYVL
jgi:hypothetical protein